MGAFLTNLARALMERERVKLGIPQQEREAQAAESADLLRRAQAARALQEIGWAPEDREIKHREAEARIRNYDEPNRLAAQPKAGTPHYEQDAQGNVTAIVPQPDGTFKTVPIGAVGTPRREPAGAAGGEGACAANPIIVTDSKGNQRLAVRVKGGGLQFVDQIGGEPVAPGPTAEQRNVEYQAQAVEPAFELVQNSLDSLKQATAGLGGKMAGMVPGTSAYFAKSRFQEQAKALLGAIVARQAGEGSRLSDEDRRAYSQAATLVNNAILLPGGVEEAQARLNDARSLLDSVMARRKGGGIAAPAASTGSSGFRIVGVRPK